MISIRAVSQSDASATRIANSVGAPSTAAVMFDASFVQMLHGPDAVPVGPRPDGAIEVVRRDADVVDAGEHAAILLNRVRL